MNKTERIANKIIGAVDKNDPAYKLQEACGKALIEQSSNGKAGNVGVWFKYSIYSGLEYHIQMWSGSANNDTFNDCIKTSEDRAKILKQAKANYQKLIDLKKKLDLPGNVMGM